MPCIQSFLDWKGEEGQGERVGERNTWWKIEERGETLRRKEWGSSGRSQNAPLVKGKEKGIVQRC